MRRTGLFYIIFSIVILKTSCGENSSGSSGGSSSAIPSGTLVVQGNLENSDDPANTSILASQPVTLQDTDGNLVGAATTDEDGSYEITIAAGSIVVEPSLSLVASSSLSTDRFLLESTIEDDGTGKALGIRQQVDLDASMVTSTTEDSSIFDIGSSPLAQIGAISGTVSFADTTVINNKTDVFIPGKSFFVRTDANGSYHFLFVPAGTYTVRIENDIYYKEIDVTVEANTTTVVGETTVAITERDPLPLEDVILGNWNTNCWRDTGDANDPVVAETGTIAIESLTSTSYTGVSCLTKSVEFSADATKEDISQIYVLSDRAIIVVYAKISTSVKSKELYSVLGHTNNSMIIDMGSKIEVFTRSD